MSCDLQVDVLMTSPQDRAFDTAKDIAKLQSLAGARAPVLQQNEGLRSRCLGSWEGRLSAEVGVVQEICERGLDVS